MSLKGQILSVLEEEPHLRLDYTTYSRFVLFLLLLLIHSDTGGSVCSRYI